ncbi:MAG TPA: alpha/beta fold hydrolase [Blastocatellia bacterium]|nr:alpha/beta fold hydrolase [Blastocatellia bacterium]
MPYADNDGTKIYWEERGSGEPLLLIMGLGYTLDMWHRTRPSLAERYRVIAFDNRGVGRSDVPPGPYAISTMASDAAAVMDAAGVDAAHVFGVSMGGMIAQEFALRYPARAKSLVLGCTTCGGPGSTAAEPEVIKTLAARATMSVEEAIHAMAHYVYDAATPRERLEEDFEIRRRTYPSSEGYLAQLRGVFEWESFSRLSQINVPTLVIHGESDRLVPPANGKLLAESIPGARLVMLPSASHIFMTDQPEAANQAILSFLAANEGRG